MSASDVKSAHTHTHITVLFGAVMYFGLRREGRRNWEAKELIYHMIAFKSLESSFLRQIFYFCNLNILNK